MIEPSLTVRRATALETRRMDETTSDIGALQTSVCGQGVRLSGLASAILESVPPGVERTLEEITADVVAEFGEPDPPASASELTDRHVHDLAAHGLLTLNGAKPPSPPVLPSAAGVAALRS